MTLFARMPTKLFGFIITCLMLSAAPAMAISPEEVMADPRLEERARNISKQLRCLVCENQSIDDSDADLARDLRREVRLQLHVGMSDDAIFDHLRNRYGDYVLLKPPVTSQTLALWGLPIIMGIFGGGLFILTRRKQRLPETPITASDDLSQHNLIKDGSTASNSSHPSHPTHHGKIILWGGVALLMTVSVGLYAALGRPDLTAQPLKNRVAEVAAATKAEAQQTAAAKSRLAEAKKAADGALSSVEAQLNYAMIAASMGDSKAERTALSRALRLTQDDPTIIALMAEAMSREAGGLVTLPARELIRKALDANPVEPRALYLKGLAAYQDEAFQDAVATWAELTTIIDPLAPLAQILAANIRTAAEEGGFVLSDELASFAQAIPQADDEQTALIASMVEGLEARLEDEPNDPEGWQRLIKSRQVLNDQDGIIRAKLGAAAASPDDATAQIQGLEELLEQGIGAQYISEAIVLMDRLKSADPDSLELLFFAGHFAVLSGEVEAAISIWTKLLNATDEDAPYRQNLIDEINQLKKLN